MKLKYDTIVIGAGQAGLAAGYYLQQAGLNFAILEADERVGGAWRRFYDSLTLFSPARYSALPGLPFPGNPDRYPLRDEVVAYLDRYAAQFDFPIITGAKVEQISKENGPHAFAGAGCFQLQLANGDRMQADTIIAATGLFGNPTQPQLPGQQQFKGQIIHAADYRQPAAYKGQRVVVVGGGNTAVQIAVELAEFATVTIASRGSIRFAPQRFGGRDIHFWLTASGVDKLPVGQWFGLTATEMVLDQEKRYQTAVNQNRPDRQPMFTQFRQDGVVWANGQFEKVDTVIYATGYRPNLPFLSGLDALDNNHRPQQKGGISQTVPGLYFVGLAWQRAHRSATLRGVGPDAAYVVRHLLAHHKSTATPALQTAGSREGVEAVS